MILGALTLMWYHRNAFEILYAVLALFPCFELILSKEYPCATRLSHNLIGQFEYSVIKLDNGKFRFP